MMGYQPRGLFWNSLSIRNFKINNFLDDLNSTKMDTPRSKYLPNHTAKVRPKLPLYATKKSDKTCESKSVTMDDILRSVKTLDDPCNFKKVEKPSAFSRSDGNLKKFQPSSSLDNTDTDNLVCRESSVSPEFTEWESEPNDTNTPSKSTSDDDVSPRSPILLSKVSFLKKCLKPDANPGGSSTADRLCNSRRLSSFESPLVTHESLENDVSDTVEKPCPVENAVVENQETLDALSVITNVDDEGDQQLRMGSVKDDQLSQKAHCEIALQCSQPPFGCSQGRFQNEANAALSVFDVSDFLSCPKTATSRGNVSLQSATDPPDFLVPPIPPSKSMDHIVVKPTQNANRDYEVQSLTSIAATINTGFTTACGKNICVSEKSLNFASQLLENVIPDDTPCLSQFETAESNEGCSNNFNCATESHNKNSPLNGKIFSSSKETSSKEILPEALNGEKLTAPFNKNETDDDDLNIPNAITDSLEVQPSSSQSSSQNTLTHSPGTGFCTAKGKNVHVSEKSLTFASNLFGSIETDLQPSESGCEPTISNTQSTSPRPIIPAHQQYRKSHCSTPSEKSMAIPSANLHEAKTLFDQCGVFELPEPRLSGTKLGSVTCGDTDKKVPEYSSFEQRASKGAPSIPKTASGISQIGETTGFSTAGGKKVLVSEKSLNFASQLLENLDAGGNLVQESEVSRVINTKSEPFRKSMFQTASGKVTSISSESLRKAKNLFDSLDVNPVDQCGVFEFPEPGLSGTKLGSVTCGGTDKKFPDCSSFEQKSSKGAPSIPKTASGISQIGETTGFSTAGGKKVLVSEKSLNFASQLLENVDAGGNLVQESEVSRVINTKSESFRKSMFQTASGKVTSISSESLRKAKNLFDSLDVNPVDQCGVFEFPEPGLSGTKLGSVTCGGTDKKFPDCSSFEQKSSKGAPSIPKTASGISQIGETTGFSTAGGKKVLVSEKSLNFASQLLENVDAGGNLVQESEVSRVINTKSESFRKSMFQTASGKVTSISSESLRKAKNLFDSLDVNPVEGNDSSQLQIRFDSNVNNDSKSVNAFCTPENVDLLDNDNELFETIETPSKTRNPCNKVTQVPLNDEVAKNDLKQNAEHFSQNVSCDSYAELQSSSTVFNDSGITTQMKNCVDNKDGARTHSLVPDDVEASPEKDPSSGPKSPVLLNGSFMGTPSPRRWQLESGKGINSDIPPSGRKFCARTGSGLKNATSDAQVTFTCFKPSSDRSPLTDLVDEGVNNHDSSSRKLEKIKKSPKTLNSSEIKEATSFKSAAGKSIEVSDESMNKVKVMFSDILDEQVKENAEESCGKMQSVDKVDATDCTEEVTDEFCSPVLLDGSFVEKSENSHLKSDIDRSIPEDGDKSHIPAVNSPSVAPEERLLPFENSSSTLDGTQVNIRLTSLNDKMLSSSDWGEFPDLKSSQAALLERQGDKLPHNPTRKENVSEANVQNKEVEWGEFPEMPCMEMCDLEQKKYVSEAKPSHVKKSVPIQSGSEFANLKPRTDKFLPNSSVTIEGDHTKNQIEALHGEDRGKRKSDPNPLQSTSKRLRVSSSPQMSGSPNKLAVRRRIREEQCAIVRSKRIQRIQPSAGKLFTTKKSSCRWQLIDLDDDLKTFNVNDVKVPVSKLVIDITSENSVDFRFGLSNARPRTVKFVEGDLIADSCLLAYANDDTAGLNEVTTSFLTSPHVDPKLVTNDWIRNHYRWIVWKLACFERTFPQRFGSSCLNVENVLLQLKYRYDREIDMVQRSSFKKMLEGDAATNKFVCCVAAVKENTLDEGELRLELELSDGWYSIWAIIDSEMVDLVNRSVVGIGTKLIVHSAELTNCKEGCDPLKVPSNVKLKISTNSVRRAKWFAKMGFTSNNNPIPALLCSVLPNGGLIGQVTAVVARKYPAIYLCKDVDGKTVFRNERSQALFREQQEKNKSDKAEQVYEQVWKEVESQYCKRGKSSLKFNSKEIQHLTDPELLFNIVDGSDMEFIQSQLSADQLGLAMQYKTETTTKINNEVQKVLQVKLSESEPTLKVTKLLKVRLVDFFTEKHALLTIWRPSDEDLSVLREGKTYEFKNLMASGTRFRDRVLQLSSTRQTIYSSNEMLEPSEDCRRVVTPLHEIDTPGFAPVFGEVDVVGVVVLVKLPEQTRGVTVVYLSDFEAHYLSITFWTSLSVFGCEDLITEGSIISCSNLQWRSVSNQRKIPSVFASEISCFSVSPKEKHLHKGVTELKAKLAEKDIEELVSSARSDILQTTGSRDLVSSPAPPAMKTPQHKKLKLMTRLSEDAPPLSPIPLTVSTRHVFQNFKSPCRTPSGPGKKQS